MLSYFIVMELDLSVIVPVYNRPNETKELIESLVNQTDKKFELVIVEDGSTLTSREVATDYQGVIDISYYFKDNSGPGDSRNYGMRKAKGNYFIILDSDCILPPNYIYEVGNSLRVDFVPCFGGVDMALDSFSDVQKAINFTMTSVLTTGGVRGASEKLGKFQPRSFNMGISKEAFDLTGGFKEIHPGEDPDLSIRLWKLGLETRLFQNVFVYHKRRIDWEKYQNQVYKFGKVRPILDSWHPEYAKITYAFPSAFILGIVFCALVLPVLLYGYAAYFAACFLLSSVQNKSLKVGIMSVWAVLVQFYGYGIGYLQSFFSVRIFKKNPREIYPGLFFKNLS